jgi:hypothetical protein
MQNMKIKLLQFVCFSNSHSLYNILSFVHNKCFLFAYFKNLRKLLKLKILDEIKKFLISILFLMRTLTLHGHGQIPVFEDFSVCGPI